jgi:glycosyltransferase involved in cell wall biosynthesis
MVSGGSAMPDPLRVLCVTPSGVEGRGGIDRLYYYLRSADLTGSMAGIDLRFGAARGNLPGALWPLAFPRHLLALARQMRAFRPQIVHINFANRSSLWRKYAVLRMAEWSGAATVIHLHDVIPHEAVIRNRLEGRLFRSICRHADRVVALGDAGAEGFRQIGVPADKLRILLNGIPEFAAGIVLPKPVGPGVAILKAGHVGERKGTDVLIEALALLSGRLPASASWSCVVAGNGEVERYRALAAARGLATRVRFTGWAEADAVHALMRAADIVVLPSRSEALPLSLIEGACAGAALVAAPVGNVAEVVRDGENGFIVARDPAALAETLADLIRNHEVRGRMQSASRRIYEERLTLSAFAQNLRAIYIDLAASRGLGLATGPTERG